MYVQIENNMIFVIDYNKSCDIMMNTQIIKGIVIDKKTKKMPVNVYTVNYSSKLNNNFYLQNKYISLQDIRNTNIIYYLQIDLIKVNYKNNKISSSTYIDTYIHSISVSSTKIIAINLFSGQILLFEELNNSPPWLLSYYLISPNQSSSLIFSSDNNLLAIGTQDNNVYIIDILTKKPLACLVGHCNYIKYIYFEDNSNEIRNTKKK
jgi:WD40 repeat protein